MHGVSQRHWLDKSMDDFEIDKLSSSFIACIWLYITDFLQVDCTHCSMSPSGVGNCRRFNGTLVISVGPRDRIWKRDAKSAVFLHGLSDGVVGHVVTRPRAPRHLTTEPSTTAISIVPAHISLYSPISLLLKNLCHFSMAIKHNMQ